MKSCCCLFFFISIICLFNLFFLLTFISSLAKYSMFGIFFFFSHYSSAEKASVSGVFRIHIFGIPEYGDLESKFSYSVQMRENTDQKSFEYGRFPCSVRFATTKRKTQWKKTHFQNQQTFRKLPPSLFSSLLTLNKYFFSYERPR